MRRATLLTLFLLATSLFLCAQDRALISGDAEDNQDTPVSDVRVTLRNDSLRVDRTTTTNADGFYYFAEVSPAQGYVITATAPGMSFAPQRVKFDVEVGETRHILPSFVGIKAQSPTSSLQPREALNVNADFRFPGAGCLAAEVDTAAATLDSTLSLQSVRRSPRTALVANAVLEVNGKVDENCSRYTTGVVDPQTPRAESAGSLHLRRKSLAALGQFSVPGFAGRHENNTD